MKKIVKTIKKTVRAKKPKESAVCETCNGSGLASPEKLCPACGGSALTK